MSTNQNEAEWAERLAKLREDEWKSGSRLQELADKIAEKVELNEKACTPEMLMKLTDAASKMGRLAIGGIEDPPAAADRNNDLLHQAATALERLTGEGEQK